MIHEEALYQVYAPLPLPLTDVFSGGPGLSGTILDLLRLRLTHLLLTFIIYTSL